MKLVSVAEMIAIEREANAAGLSYAQMMDYAGHNLAQVVAEVYGPLDERRVMGLIGPGNNGGDTLVALAWLASHGWTARAYLVRERPPDDPLVLRLQHAGGVVYTRKDDPDLSLLAQLLERESVVLDGILGTGIRLPLKPEMAGILESIQCLLAKVQTPTEIVAVDVPSGVDCDNGEAAPQTLRANLTVTMAAVKLGLLKFPANNLVGELRLVEIGLPEGGEGLAAWRRVKRCVVDAKQVCAVLPPRPLDAHKGSFGTVMVVAGSLAYSGAALLAAEAAYRAGAGLVTLAAPLPLHNALAGHLPEATWLPLAHQEGWIAEAGADQVLGGLGRTTALLVGPGFGLQQTTQKFLEHLFLSDSLPPLVLDADGLKLTARLEGWPERLPPGAILTPHPGEMSVLTGLNSAEITANRMEIAESHSQRWGHIVVLKGPFTVIAAPDGRTAVIPVATPALARAGTGDVLAGLISGLRAQGVSPFEAAYAGAWIHAQAGLRAAAELGSTQVVLASDVLKATIRIFATLSKA